MADIRRKMQKLLNMTRAELEQVAQDESQPQACRNIAGVLLEEPQNMTKLERIIKQAYDAPDAEPFTRWDEPD